MEELTNLVRIQTGSETEADFRQLCEDVLSCSVGAAGGFSGFIYYSETVDFAQCNLPYILEHLREISEDIGDANIYQTISGFGCINLTAEEVSEGMYKADSDHETEVYNALAWFALEEVAHHVIEQ